MRLVLLAACSVPAVALAHNQPTPIELWGPFLPATQTCLRVISRAAHACFDTVLAVEQRCHDALLRGAGCDRAALDAEVAAATAAARTTLTTECRLGQLTELGYNGVFDAAADMDKACAIQARAAIAAAYAPAAAGPLSEAGAACVETSAAYARKVMRFILERETPIMERLATRLFSAEEKKASLAQIERELSATRQRWIDGVLERCPAFPTVYGRSAESLLRTIKQRTDCVLSLTYVHSAVSCAPPTCGNGIPEGEEECDDGNGDDSDRCRNDCTNRPGL